MQAIPAAIFLLALTMIPESPRYLVSKGRNESAESVLTKLMEAELRGASSMKSAPLLQKTTVLA